jgi:hypothetical protein
MNWGWDGRENDWYFQTDWNPPNMGNYQYQQKIIYNIQP